MGGGTFVDGEGKDTDPLGVVAVEEDSVGVLPFVFIFLPLFVPGVVEGSTVLTVTVYVPPVVLTKFCRYWISIGGVVTGTNKGIGNLCCFAVRI